VMESRAQSGGKATHPIGLLCISRPLMQLFEGADVPRFKPKEPHEIPESPRPPRGCCPLSC